MDAHDTPNASLNYTPGFDEFEVAEHREPPLLYPMAEAAAMLGISRSNLYGLLRAGRLCSVRIGSRRLIPRASLETFVESLATAP